MYQYEWDPETGGVLLKPQQSKSSNEPRPVYYREMNLLGMNKRWSYPQNDDAPIMFAEAERYIYFGRVIAKTRGGSLYTAPEVIYTENEQGEPEGATLTPVDVRGMVEKNRELLISLREATVQKLNSEAYQKYKNKVDAFHLSYSGGKDSQVLLDIVQRTLPHNDFFVLFADTGMEFPDTYIAMETAKKWCTEHDISFYTAKSHLNPLDTWKVFGPPASTIRWCCSVHKTTPQLLMLRDIIGKDDLIEMAFVGVRGDESARRSEYDYISRGLKHKGQYSCNVILDWSSAEVFLYLYYLEMFEDGIPINEAYKKGNGRAGCLVCPMSAGKADFMRYANYREKMDDFMDIVRMMNGKDLPTQKDTDRYIETGGWKARINGRDIKGMPPKYIEHSLCDIEVIAPYQDWRQWLKTIGYYEINGNTVTLKRNTNTYVFTVTPTKDGFRIVIPEEMVTKPPKEGKLIRQVFHKVAYCIGCKECQADCPYGCISFVDGKVKIADNCHRCMNCHKAPDGCLLYKSLELPKGNGNMLNKSLDCYADHAPKYEWIESFFALKNDFFIEHSLGSMQINFFGRFLRDAGLTQKNQMTNFAMSLDRIGISTSAFWALMLVNLAYSPEIGWYIKNVPFYTDCTREEIEEKLKESGAKDRGASSIIKAYKRILELPFGSLINLGTVNMDGKKYLGFTRGIWSTPIPEVILYALYKFAEACGNYHQFTLTYLMDESIEREGVSPTAIFGLDRDTMVRILNGLSINYPEFISASFSFDLDTITLRKDKKAEDVLELL